MADKATLLYAGIFLNGPSRLQLLNLAPPKHTALSANHLTLIHRPCFSDLQKLPLGRIESLHVTATLSTSSSRYQTDVADLVTSCRIHLFVERGYCLLLRDSHFLLACLLACLLA